MRIVCFVGVAAIAWAGCARSGPPRVAHVSSVASAPSSTASPIASANADGNADTSPPSLCDRLRSDEGLLATDATPDGRRFGCWPSARGAWALRFDPPNDVGRAHRTLTHVARDGAKVTLGAAIDDENNFTTLSFADSVVLFDFDGDGEDEIFFRAQVTGYESTTVDAALFAFVGETIVAYGPTAKLAIDRVYDEDADGRPDAAVIFALGGYKGCDYCAGSDQEVTLVAHGRADGTFSFTDDHATALVKKRCPARSRASYVDPKADYVDPARVVCDRLWGVPRAPIVAQLRRECAPYAKAAAECRGPCRNLDQAIQYASFTPPMTLR